MYMKLSRRRFLLGTSSLAASLSLPPHKLEAWPKKGALSIGHGWNVLPLGCGGFVTGMFIANDGSMVCRADIGNIYRWSGLTTDYADAAKAWVPLLNVTSLAGQGPGGGDPVVADNPGGYEHVLAPNNSTVHGAIFADMQGDATKGWFWYSTNSGALWNKSNISFGNYSTATNEPAKFAQQKIAFDPANPNIVYVGTVRDDGLSAGAYTSLNKSGGSSLGTLVSVKTSGSTPIPDTVACSYMPQTNQSSGVAITVSTGIAIDANSGTTTIGGQTVTNRIIIPIAGSGIYESTDGGDTFTEVAASAMGTADFYVSTGYFTAEGIYYCIVTSSTIGGVWRYRSGTWAKISTGVSADVSYPATYYYSGNTYLIVDPRNNSTSKAYLSVFGPNGFGVGYTSQNANTATAASVTWTGATGGEIPTMKSESYDIYYINDIFGQGLNGYTAANGAAIDSNGICWWPGNQSLFYVGVSSSDSTPAGPPIYSNTGSANTVASWSMGRGMECTVAEDALCPPGGTYAVLAVQDLGAPMRGTFTTYPRTMAVPFQEWTNECLEYAASDPSFVVARITGQSGAHAITDASKYSTNYGVDGSWTELSAYPSYNATLTGSISGTTLTVTACTGVIRESAYISSAALSGGSYYGIVQPYGTGGTTGTGGTGTYILDTSSTVASGSLFSTQFVQGGQTVAVDHDHWVTVPSGFGGQDYVPTYTTNATGAATWATCSGLPSWKWTSRGWAFGGASKPLAVGYGSDLGTVWAWKVPNLTSGTATLYRSTDSGASFSSIGTQSVGITALGAYCLSVPGFPNELWVSALFVGGSPTDLWHVTNANTSSATFTAVNLPADANGVYNFTLGAPETPGQYPTIYLIGRLLGTDTIKKLYKGTYPGTGSTVTWERYGPTGLQKDLPPVCQLQGWQSIRGDFNKYGRLYAPTSACGLAYYNP